MKIVKLSKESQIEELSQGKDRLVIVDFFAEWCGPCRLLSEKLEGMEDGNENVTVLKADVEDFEELSEKYNVRNIPTLIFIQNGMIVDRNVGMIEPTELKKIISSHISEQ